MVAKPDRTVRRPVERCVGRGRSLANHAPARVERRRVFDLPEPKPEVTGHQAEVSATGGSASGGKTCACGCLNGDGNPLGCLVVAHQFFHEVHRQGVMVSKTTGVLAAGAFAAVAGGLAGVFACLAGGDTQPLLWAAVPPAGAAASLCLWRALVRRAGEGGHFVASVPFLALLIPMFFFPDYLVGTGPSLVISVALAAITVSGFVAVVFLMFSAASPAWESGLERRSRAIVIAAIIIFTGAAIVHSVAMYRAFGYPGHDLCVFTQSFWTSLHGRLFWNTEEHYPGCSRFGKQLCPIMFLLVPFFKCAPHCATIFALDALALGLGGLVVYRFAQDDLGGYAAACFALSYLMHPGISYQALVPYYFMHYAPLFLLLALYFFAQKRLGAFMVALLLAWSTREDIALTTGMFGIYALVRRRRAAWVAIPILGSMLWFAIAVWVVIPALGPGTMRFLFRDTSGCIGGITRAFLVEPGAVCARLLSPGMIRLAYLVLMPLGILLPLASAEVLFALPTYLILGISSQETTRLIDYYYYLPAVPFLFAGAVAVVARCSRCVALPFATQRQAANVISTLVLFLSCAVFVRGPLNETLHAGIHPFGSPPDAGYTEALRRAVNLIPCDVSVFTPRYLAPHLAKRMVVMFKTPCDAEYLIVDMHTKDQQTRGIQNNPFIRSLGSNPAYRAIFEERGVAVYRRAGAR